MCMEWLTTPLPHILRFHSKNISPSKPLDEISTRQRSTSYGALCKQTWRS
jgi:hypothetical protein